ATPSPAAIWPMRASPSRSATWRARGCSRSPWGRCTPASSSPATSASPSRARRSSTSRRAWASSTRARRSSSRRCRSHGRPSWPSACPATPARATHWPTARRWRRTVLLELERLYNHVADVGMIVNDTGFGFGHAHCFRIREELLRLNGRAAGHRLLRGAIVPGGVTGPITRAGLAEVAATVERLVADFEEIAGLSLANTMVLERLQGTGRLTPATAREMQVVGLVARASGIDADARRDAPFAAYGELDVRVAGYDAGDVWARTVLRIDEAREAARLIRAAAGRAPEGPTRASLPPLPAGEHAFGLVEAWRGPVWHWVLAEGPTALGRVKIVD